MQPLEPGGRSQLSTMLICPNRALAQQFGVTIPETKAFHIAADLKRYPTPQQLEARLRQLRPDVVLVDISADTDTALSLIQVVAGFRPTVHVITIHEENDAQLIIRALRSGSTEFLSSPFDVESQMTVISRIMRLRETEERTAPQRGKVLAFCGSKAGQGSTTVAANTAFALCGEGKRKTFLGDFDLMGGTLSFSLRLNHSYSVLDAIRHSEKMDNTLWTALVTNRMSVDVLLAPERPEWVNFEPHRVHEVIEYARTIYEIVVVDLPSAYERIAQATLQEADRIYMVCNPELPSLHLTRKCINHLEQAGVNRDQLSLIVNRMSRRQELNQQDMEKVFNFPISHVFPEDKGAAHRALTQGKPIASNCELGRAMRNFADSIFGTGNGQKKRAFGAFGLSAIMPGN